MTMTRRPRTWLVLVLLVRQDLFQSVHSGLELRRRQLLFDQPRAFPALLLGLPLCRLPIRGLQLVSGYTYINIDAEHMTILSQLIKLAVSSEGRTRSMHACKDSSGQ